MALSKQELSLPTGGLNLTSPDLEEDEAFYIENLTTVDSQTSSPLISTRPSLGRVSSHVAGVPSGSVEKMVYLHTFLIYTTSDMDIMKSGPPHSVLYNSPTGSVPKAEWSLARMFSSGGVDTIWATTNEASNVNQKVSGLAPVTANWANTPPKGKYSCVWKQRMIISGVDAQPQRVFFSDVGNPESPSGSYGTNWIDLRGRLPVTVRGVVAMGEVLMVTTNVGIFMIYDAVSFENRQVFDGEIDQGAVEYKDRLYFLLQNPSGNALYSIDGQGTEFKFESPQVPSVGEIHGVDYERGRLFLVAKANLEFQPGVFTSQYFEVELDSKNSRGNKPFFLWSTHPCTIFPMRETGEVFFVRGGSPIKFYLTGGAVDSGQYTAVDKDTVDPEEISRRAVFHNRISLKDNETLERLRKIGLYYYGEPVISVSTEQALFRDWARKFNSDSLSDWSPDKASDGSDLVYDFTKQLPLVADDYVSDFHQDLYGYDLARPETRGRHQVVRVGRKTGSLEPVSFLNKIEISYRKAGV